MARDGYQDRVNAAIDSRHGSTANKMVSQGAKRITQKVAPYMVGQLTMGRLAENAKSPTPVSEAPVALSNSASKKSAGQSQSSSMKATIINSQKLGNQRNPMISA